MTKIFTVLLCLMCFLGMAQTKAKQDSVIIEKDDSLIAQSKDTVLLKSYATRYNPRKALLYAAVLPGLGQVYTKKYWKIPLVYAGFVGFGYSISDAQKHYTDFKSKLFEGLNSGFNTTKVPYTEENYRSAINRARRQRDFMIILMGGLYILQMIDAHVDAHLKEFDLNPQLQVRLEPMMEYSPTLGRQTGLSVYLRF